MLKIKFYTFHTASYTVFVCKASRNCTHTFDLEYRIKMSSVKTDFKTYSNFEDHDSVHVNNAPREKTIPKFQFMRAIDVRHWKLLTNWWLT